MISMTLDHTHDGTARSWVDSANDFTGDFPIQNLPFGVFRRRGANESFRGGVAIGAQIVDLAALVKTSCLSGAAKEAAEACVDPALNGFFRLGRPAWRELRHALFGLLHETVQSANLRSDVARCLVPQSEAEYVTPVQIGDYSDFYTSYYHAVNIGRMFGIATEGSNFEWIPIAYHGRVSSIGVSGQKFNRPIGQTRLPNANAPMLGPSKKLDYEVELAIYIGAGNSPGRPIPLDDVDQHVFGIGLLNDWSARDIQAWEMHPLGPFLAKNFATTVSPWIVSLDALAPFRVPHERPGGTPQPLPYLRSPDHARHGAIDIQLEALIETSVGRLGRKPPSRLSRTSFRHQFWTVAQMVAHHTINGCNLRPGDVLGSGTISGPTAEEAGALMELAQNGALPFTLKSGETRSFVEDGDAVILRGFCERPNFARIGFGESRGEVLPALVSG
jgi:fumarylacetoacetase